MPPKVVPPPLRGSVARNSVAALGQPPPPPGRPPYETSEQPPPPPGPPPAEGSPTGVGLPTGAVPVNQSGTGRSRAIHLACRALCVLTSAFGKIILTLDYAIQQLRLEGARDNFEQDIELSTYLPAPVRVEHRGQALSYLASRLSRLRREIVQVQEAIDELERQEVLFGTLTLANEMRVPRWLARPRATGARSSE